MTTTIIAEIGVNHDGDLSKALRLCDAAKDAGADLAKFQTFHPDLFRDPAARDRMAPLVLSAEQFKIIARHCETIGIEFCSTPDDLDSLKCLVDECGVKRIKIGSGSLVYEPLVDACFDTGLPILLSTGMATISEVRDVVRRQRTRWLRKADAGPMNHLTLMHCVSLYPCPAELANVAAIRELDILIKDVYWPMNFFTLGYSDHTIGDYAAGAAVALGATVVEKHFTLNNNDDGPDHFMSVTTEGLRSLISVIHGVEEVLGDGIKRPSEQESAMIPRVRKDAEGFQPGL